MRILLALSIWIVVGWGVAQAQISTIVGASAAAPTGIPSCPTFSYVLQSTLTLPEGFRVNSISPQHGTDNGGSVLIFESAAPNRVHLYQFTQSPFLLGPRVELSSGNSPIQTGSIFTSILDTTGGPHRGKTFVAYQPPPALCPIGGFTCIGLMRVAGVSVESTVAIIGRQTNLYGLSQNSNELYVLVDGDGSAVGTVRRELYRISKDSLASIGQITLDPNNNGGGGQHNPAFGTAFDFVYAGESFTDTVKKVPFSLASISGSTVNLASNARGMTVTGIGLPPTERVVSMLDANSINVSLVSTMAGGTTALPANQTARTNSLHPDPTCRTIHMGVNASAGTVSIQRINADTLAYANTFSDAGFQLGSATGYNPFNKLFFIGNGGAPEQVGSVRVSP